MAPSHTCRSLIYSPAKTRSKQELGSQVTTVSKNANFHFVQEQREGVTATQWPWILLKKKPSWKTGLVCPPVTVSYFKQHALKVQRYNQPITLKTCWSRTPAPSKAPQTSHNSGTEVPEEGLSQRWSKEPVPVTPKPGAQPGQSTKEPELSPWNLSQQGERDDLHWDSSYRSKGIK